jgi:hypothetical protein
MISETSEELTMNEVAVKYPGKWVAAKVVEREKQSGQPLKVEVLISDSDIFSIRNKISLDGICTFFTGSIPEEPYVMMY